MPNPSEKVEQNKVKQAQNTDTQLKLNQLALQSAPKAKIAEPVLRINKTIEKPLKVAAAKNLSSIYTIQLIAAHAENSLQAFIKTYGLKDFTKSTNTNAQGEIWHVLTYGQYDSFAEAQAALQQLPAKLKAKKPFIRRILDESEQNAESGAQNLKMAS